MHDSQPSSSPRKRSALASFMFASRWLQLPLYLGLILAQCVYVFHFWVELKDLVLAAMGNEAALQHIFQAVAVPGAPLPNKLNETTIMLVVLGLIDVVMISNLLIMVIVGGYETFVSRMYLEDHPDQPEWLSHVNASVLKTKLAMAIIGISSIHLLKTFIAAGALKGLPFCTAEQLAEMKAQLAITSTQCTQMTSDGVMWQTIIHCVFILSAIGIAYTDRLMSAASAKTHKDAHAH